MHSADCQTCPHKMWRTDCATVCGGESHFCRSETTEVWRLKPLAGLHTLAKHTQTCTPGTVHTSHRRLRSVFPWIFLLTAPIISLHWLSLLHSLSDHGLVVPHFTGQFFSLSVSLPYSSPSTHTLLCLVLFVHSWTAQKNKFASKQIKNIYNIWHLLSSAPQFGTKKTKDTIQRLQAYVFMTYLVWHYLVLGFITLIKPGDPRHCCNV